MMRHFVALKFEDGYLDEGQFRQISAQFFKLQPTLSAQVKRVDVYRNCIERDSNMDLMVEILLDCPDALAIYLNHPLHLKIMKDLLPHVISRVSFDHMIL